MRCELYRETVLPHDQEQLFLWPQKLSWGGSNCPRAMDTVKAEDPYHLHYWQTLLTPHSLPTEQSGRGCLESPLEVEWNGGVS